MGGQKWSPIFILLITIIKLTVMKKFEKQSLVWFVIYLLVLGSVILSTSSCRTTYCDHVKNNYTGYKW